MNLKKVLDEIRACRASGATELSIELEGLESLPPEIGQLTALTSFILYANSLTALPPEIGQLTALTSLDVRANSLTALPPEIGQLAALTSLDVSFNKLTALPSFAPTQFPDLDNLNAHNNPLIDPPLRVVEQGVAAVRRYFSLGARQRRGSWVMVGSRLSRHFHLRSALAAVETAGMIIAVIVCARVPWPEPVWMAAAIAPMLLLKTRASITLGTRRFAALMRRLGLKAREQAVSGASLPNYTPGLIRCRSFPAGTCVG